MNGNGDDPAIPAVPGSARAALGEPRPVVTAESPTDAWRRRLSALAPYLALLAVWLFFGLAVAISNPEKPFLFFAPGNQAAILSQTVVVAIAALGMTMLIVGGGIDLSCGSTIALSGVVGAVTLSVLAGSGTPTAAYAWAPLAAAAVAVLTGALIGLVNGAVIAGTGIMPFIATLGMLGIARGLAKAFANEQSVNFPRTWLTDLMRPMPLPGDPLWKQALVVAGGVWIAVALAALMTVVMRRGVFGRHVYALGSNEAAARLCGIRVRALKVTIYALAGAFFGLAGLMQTARLGQGDPTTAAGLELDIIAAVVIGGASLSGGIGTISGAMVGALIMAVLRNGSNQLGWATWRQEIIIGAIIIAAAVFDRYLRQRRAA